MTETSSTLTSMGDGAWRVASVLRMPGGVQMPVAMTVLRSGSGLVVVAPLPALDDARAEAIAALGAVRAVVAPNLWHHLGAAAALARWPGARLVAPAGLAAKRPDLPPSATLGTDEAAALLGDAVQALPMEGVPKMGEWSLVHGPSGTAVVTDLVFNVVSSDSWVTRAVLRWVSGVYGGVAVSRVWRAMVRDRAAMSTSLVRLLHAPFDRLVMAHGDVIERGGRDALAHATRGLRGG